MKPFGAALLLAVAASSGCAVIRESAALSFHSLTTLNPSPPERRTLPHGIGNVCSRGSLSWIVPVGDAVVLVDTGFDDDAAAIRHALGDRELLGILITHGHVDHVAGTASLDAPVWVGRADLPALRGEHTFPAFYPMIGEALAGIPIARGALHPVDDGDVVTFQRGDVVVRFEAIATPGHTRGSISWRYERILFGGDALQSPVDKSVYPAPPGFTEDLVAAYDSIRRMRDIDVDYLADAHYGVLENPAEAMRAALDRDHDDVERMAYPSFRPVGCGDDPVL